MLSIWFFITLIGSVFSLPIFTGNLFNIGCTSPIQQELSQVQGLTPDLQSEAPFGYLYRLDTPTLRMGPDISLNHDIEILPRFATSILSSVTYDEFNAKLVFRGRISKLNSYRLKRVPSMEGTIMTVRFDTFKAHDNMWYNVLGSSSGGITGRIEYLDVQQMINGRVMYQELVMELTPDENTFHNNDSIHYQSGVTSPVKHLDWTGKGNSGCRNYKQVNSKKDQFHETFESAVLL